MIKKVLAASMLVGLVGCGTDADIASRNLSKAADMFEVDRRIVFINTWSDKYLLVVEGRCSIKDANKQLEVTCKDGANSYKKHFLGLSRHVTYVAEQLESSNVSVYNYRVIFKPESLIPNIDLETSITN
jgi:hypothetical protein